VSPSIGPALPWNRDGARTLEAVLGPDLPIAVRAYARQVERRPVFGEYPRKTSRTIPVIALEPVR
jgi:hypothetical protein